MDGIGTVGLLVAGIDVDKLLGAGKFVRQGQGAIVKQGRTNFKLTSLLLKFGMLFNGAQQAGVDRSMVKANCLYPGSKLIFW